MSLQIGIVGLPNVGKSTVFNALTGAHAAVAGYPFTTIDPNVGVAAVPDPRLDALARLIRPEKVVPATVEFVDIAGLVAGASQGAGLGNQFLGHIRNVDAVAMVVRAFHDPDIPHVSERLDPVSDIATVDTELLLADLATLQRRQEKLHVQSKAAPKEYAAEMHLLERAVAHANAGKLLRTLPINEVEAELLRPLNLLTAKPRLYVVNVGEADLPDGGEAARRVRQHAAQEGAAVVVLCAALEAELNTWPPEEAAAYRADLGLPEPGLNALIRAGFALLDLITFFTATGGQVLRAWELRRGSTVWEAAGKIHSDMQRGFIRAEVVSVQDLLAAGSMAHARDLGVVHLHGRDYIVQDGDVIHIRFHA
ncbi:MAG: redox-regulated ATPase YchF [Caldilineales bacterium]|nr:redox-regulated ATPase YchF [Caldilineales bacterium]MDW8318623.1 redox-regulated ATPase YchF [Anaerolineae bacterium]